MTVTRKIISALFAGAALVVLGGTVLPSAQAQAFTEHDRVIYQKIADLENFRKQEAAARQQPGFKASYWATQEAKKVKYWNIQLVRTDSAAGTTYTDEHDRLIYQKIADLENLRQQETAARSQPGFKASRWSAQIREKENYWNKKIAATK